MMESDPLRAVLREWEAPEPGAGLDARVRDAWRSRCPARGRRVWAARLRVLVPVSIALSLVLAAVLIKPVARTGTESYVTPDSYVTKLDAAGLRPVPNGVARVVSVKEVEP